jgi:AAA domain-containing protein
MRLTSLSISGFRGFNDAQILDLSEAIAIFEGPNGSGKTAIGEAFEWLLYGQTLKRSKGDDLSKREYAGCYRNAHYVGSAPPYVESEFEDQNGKARKIRRELKADETSVLKVDGAVVSNLKEFGIDHVHDRPMILQHTLQDFIFMRPKARYEVLSAMMGLEPLIALRTTVEAAKTDFSKRLPQRASEAQSRRTLLVLELRREPVLSPVASLIESGALAAARAHLDQVAQGLAPSGSGDLLQALKTAKAAKERAQLDWGRFSSAVINHPAQAPAITRLADLNTRVTRLRHYLHEAQVTTASAQAPEREKNPQRRQFYQLGIQLVDGAHPENCPFCAANSLSPARISAITEAVAETPAGVSAIERARAEVSGLSTDLQTQLAELRRLVPTCPDGADEQKIRVIGGAGAAAFLESNAALKAQLAAFSEALDRLNVSRLAVEAALTASSIQEEGAEDLDHAVAVYAAAVREIPALINAYAANYSLIDPAIRTGLASSADVKKIERTITALEQWKDMEIAQACRDIERSFTDLIGDIRTFTEKKQK